MKKRFLLPTLLLCFNALLFAQKPVPDGAYQLLSGQYGDTPSKTAAEYEMRIMKILKDGYWICAFFGEEDRPFHESNGFGGGTYVFKDGKYVETLSFYSWDSTAVGKTYTFDYSVEGKYYHQWGKIQSDRYQNYVIDEMFQKVQSAEPLKNSGLEGVWFLESAKWANSSYNGSTDDMVEMKIYAYPMVIYGNWNKKTHSFVAGGACKYQFDGKTSTEQVAYSTWEGETGKTHQIDIKLENGTYTQEWGGNNREVWRKAGYKTVVGSN